MKNRDASVTTTGPRAARGEATRTAVLTAAEQLFAVHGVNNVSQRRIVEAAGQANTGAVAYHFGSTADLVRAIERKHAEHVDALLAHYVAGVGDSRDLVDWVACLVRPYTDHLASLGHPCWFARFCAQVMTDPVYSEVMTDSALTSPPLQQVLAGIAECVPDLPEKVRTERFTFTTLVLNQGCAYYEAAFDEGRQAPRSDWDEVGSGLIDSMVGLWRAPVTMIR